MGRTISIWAVCLTLVLAGFSFNSSPVMTEKEGFKILDIEKMTFQVDTDNDLRFFLKAAFNEAEGEITFLTRESTAQIRVYNSLGSMVYLLPVNSDRISLGESLFQKGEYVFNFDTASDRQMYTTLLTIH